MGVRFGRRRRAAVIVVACTLVAGLVATVPPAQAFGPSAQSLPASLFLGNTPAATNATTNNTYSDTLTLTLSPSGTQNVGTLITVGLSGVTGPLTGPVPVNPNGSIVRATIGLTGAMSGSVALTSGATCTYPATGIGTNSPQGPWAVSGTFTTTGVGAAAARLRQIFFDDQGNLDGSVATVCTGTSNNADYYASSVSQTSGSNQPGLAKTAPQDSTVIVEPFGIGGPNATITNSSGQNLGVQAIRFSTAFTSFVSLTGSLWPANQPSSAIQVDFCDVTGASCTNPGFVFQNFLTTNASGNLAGSLLHLSGSPGPTTGNRAIKITIGSSTALVPVLVLALPTLTLSPAGQSPGAPVSLSGSNFNPLQPVNAQGVTLVTGISSWIPSTDPAAVLGTSSATGTVTGSYTVNALNTTFIAAWQDGAPGPATASNPAGYAQVFFLPDRCIAYGSNLTGGPGCDTKANVGVSVQQGRLTQRAYLNTTPTVGSIGSTATTPVAGTANVNSSATQVNLGSITSPLAPATIVGTLNDVTVSDSRGGTFGWTLSASLTAFSGQPTGSIAASALSASPTCAAATAANAWDYDAPGQTVIAGFDPSSVAPGAAPGSTGQSFASTVNLCTKSTATNPTSQSSGGVYTVGSPLTLVVPAFQLAGRYTATMTITLA